MPKVVVTDASYPHLEREREAAERRGAQFLAAECKTAAEVIEAVRGAHVVLVQYAKVTDEVLAQLAPNALVIRYGIGLDNIDLKAAQQRGIRVAHVPDYATGEVADHTAALILAMLRKIIPLDRSLREGRWEADSVCQSMPAFAELRIGYVGFGRIGQQLFARMTPFGFQSIVTDPLVTATQLRELGAQPAELEHLFHEADVITLHAPLTESTRHLVNARRLASMKATAVIVNTARGGLIDTTALEDALLHGKLGGAALDVFEEEPLPVTSRLRSFPNVILTPHAAWYSKQAMERIQALAADEVERALCGLPARCPAPMM